MLPLDFPIADSCLHLIEGTAATAPLYMDGYEALVLRTARVEGFFVFGVRNVSIPFAAPAMTGHVLASLSREDAPP
ncbi:MAG TPA: hypothetical protein VF453_03185 [Burkholderiaceae bacterium]